MVSTRTPRTVTGWFGWIMFAAVVLIINGIFNLIDGLVSLFNEDVYVQTKDGLVVFDFTAWGWILLIVGALQLLSGICILATGALWARITAIVLASISAIAQIGFITAFPLWSVMVIILDMLVLWALVVHGEEAKKINQP